jgi:hypothetical protein
MNRRIALLPDAHSVLDQGHPPTPADPTCSQREDGSPLDPVAADSPPQRVDLAPSTLRTVAPIVHAPGSAALWAADRFAASRQPAAAHVRSGCRSSERRSRRLVRSQRPDGGPGCFCRRRRRAWPTAWSSVSAMPSTVLANQHCGLRQSCSSGAIHAGIVGCGPRSSVVTSRARGAKLVIRPQHDGLVGRHVGGAARKVGPSARRTRTRGSRRRRFELV